MRSAGTIERDARGERVTTVLCNFLSKAAGYTLQDFLARMRTVGIYVAYRPPQHVEILMVSGADVPILECDEGTTLRPSFPDVPPLQVAWKQNPGVLV